MIRYGYAKISKEMQEEISQFIRDYLLARGALKLVLLLVDPRRDALQSDVEMLDVRRGRKGREYYLEFVVRIHLIEIDDYYSPSVPGGDRRHCRSGGHEDR